MSEQEQRLIQYEEMLRRIDWNYHFSDDPHVFRTNDALMQRIYRMQPSVDPDSSIFNRYKPRRS